MSEPTAFVRLPPHGSSVAAARSFLTGTLHEHGLAHLVDDATLAASELVTNAVLHTRTHVVVSLRVDPATVRVTVHDDDGTLPVLRDYGADATTGRGLGLVQALALDLGAERTDDGKAVWFTLLAHPGPDRHAVAGPVPTGLPTMPPPPDPRPVVAVLVDLPVGLWREARRHDEAALREMVLVRGERLPETFEAWTWFSDAMAAHADLDAAVEHALGALDGAAAPEALTVEVPVTDGLAHRTRQLLRTLGEAEDLAAAGAMLLPPAPAEVVALRTWRCGQVIAQAAGGRPTSWPRAARDLA